ncbi:MAG: rhomboid family intramembrane serine protease [Verrucomicrobia bacterium]|jgi:membrane associated rhomboid family serine protease|nr:rhomboid family intramembrane serine protease [Verrucomicrobiota bacterium]
MQEPPPAPAARISARTRRQAMDWSLVLASQGIEHGIEHAEEKGWSLVVAAPDYATSLAAIRQYRVENLRWLWRRPIFKPGLFFDWGSAAWVLLTFGFFWLSESRADLRSVGMMDGAALAHGEWWRLFTATLLHADLAHLAMNAVFGLVLLGLAMGRFGTGVGLLAAFLAGAGGNAVAWLVHGGSHRGLGASGVVMGALGLLAVQSLTLVRQSPNALKLVMGGIVGGVLLFVLLGLNPEPRTDLVAHLDGFVAGLLLGAVLALVPRLAQRPRVNLAAGFVFTALVILTWALALVPRR